MTSVNSNRRRRTASDGMVLVITRDHDTVDDYVSDYDLLQLALAGNEPAFTALYRRRQGAVYRFALQMTGSVVIAEDVTQEVFMELIEHGRRFDPARGALASFLYGVARNLVLRRIDKDRMTCWEPAQENEIADFACIDDVLGDLTRRETIEQVRRAVLSLPPVYREAVVLCDLQDLSYDDAAQALDCPVGTVRSRLNRGRGMLAQKLRPAKRGCENPGQEFKRSAAPARASGGAA
jgi:RNA polymerase sigma-70 factor, ECF subfamily